MIILWDIKLCQMCSMTFHLQIFQMFPRNQKLGRRRQVLPLPNLHLRHQDLPGKRSTRLCSMNLSQHQRYKYSNSMNLVQRAEKDIKVHIRNCESPFQYPGFYTVLETRFESPFQYPGCYTRKKFKVNVEVWSKLL